MEKSHHDQNHEELRRSQNGTQWGSDRNDHDRERNIDKREDEGLLADEGESDAKTDWGSVDPQSESYDPDTDPSGPGSAV